MKLVNYSSPNMIATILKHCPELEMLDMNSSIFDDQCCEALLQCPNLEVLRAKRTNVTEKGTRLRKFVPYLDA